MSSIYVGGSFDLFHWGHVELLRQARQIADYVYVAVNSDDFYHAYRGGWPVMGEEERLRVVEACRYVDTAFIIEQDQQRPIIERIKPTFILHGNDWTGDSLIRQLGITQEFLDQHGIVMRYVPYTTGISTSEIKRRLRE